MSRTNIHKEKGKFNAGLIEKASISLQKQWDRQNYDVDLGRAEKRIKVERQADKEMRIELDKRKE